MLSNYDTVTARNKGINSYLTPTGGNITGTVNITSSSLSLGSRGGYYSINLYDNNEYGFGVNGNLMLFAYLIS
jgi:hypothetical protein